MGRNDSISNRYMKNPDKFADFFNGFIYDGKRVIKPELLEEVDTSNIAIIPYSIGKKALVIKKMRDIIKHTIVMKSDTSYFALLGIENQTDIHYAMPVRNMLYNALAYTEQVEKIAAYNREHKKCDSNDYISGYTNEDRLLPVITATIYWGTKPWDAPTTLKEMLVDTDEEMDSFIDDINCNLFSIIDLKDMPEFQTELKELFAILKDRNDIKALSTIVSSDERYKHINNDTADMIEEFSQLKIQRKERDGERNVCKAVEDLKRMSAEYTLINTIINYMIDTKTPYKETCALHRISEEDMERFRKINVQEEYDLFHPDPNIPTIEELEKEMVNMAEYTGAIYVKGIKRMIKIDLDDKIPQEEICEKLQKYYGLKKDEALKYIRENQGC